MSLIKALDQLNHGIPLSQAIEMTARYRPFREAILKPEFQGMELLPLSETFNRAAFEKLLAQPGCAGIRAYLGMDAEKKVKLIFVGVNDANEDILPSKPIAASAAATSGITPPGATADGDDDDDDDGGVVEEGQRCPPLCPPSSPLNQP